MELKYLFMIIIGVIVAILLCVIPVSKKAKYVGGKKIADLFNLENEQYYKKKLAQYKWLSRLVFAAYAVTIIASFTLMARPYIEIKEEQDEYNRDIILCMDVSTSVTELNLQLIEKLKETVSNMKGDRIGIVIFNTSSVVVSPLTTDTDYVNSILDKLHTCMLNQDDATSDEYAFLFQGTLVGNEIRGSSLISDGLAGSVYDFPNLDEKRSRIIIMSTDNDPQGKPIVTMDEAVEICKENNVTVYGIGTKEMTDDNAKEYKNTVESTGGSYYQEYNSGSMESIVADIDLKAKNLNKSEPKIHETDKPEIPVIMLVVSTMAMYAITKVLKV